MSMPQSNGDVARPGASELTMAPSSDSRPPLMSQVALLLLDKVNQIEEDLQRQRAGADSEKGCKEANASQEALKARISVIEEQMKTINEKDEQRQGVQDTLQSKLAELEKTVQGLGSVLDAMSNKYQDDLSNYNKELFRLKMSLSETQSELTSHAQGNRLTGAVATATSCPDEEGSAVLRQAIHDAFAKREEEDKRLLSSHKECLEEVAKLKKEVAQLKSTQAYLGENVSICTTRLPSLSQEGERRGSIVGSSSEARQSSRDTVETTTTFEATSAPKDSDGATAAREQLLSLPPSKETINLHEPERERSSSPSCSADKLEAPSCSESICIAGSASVRDNQSSSVGLVDNTPGRLPNVPTESRSAHGDLAQTTEQPLTRGMDAQASASQGRHDSLSSRLSSEDAVGDTRLVARMSNESSNLNSYSLFRQSHKHFHERMYFWINIFYNHLSNNWRGLMASIIEAEDDTRSEHVPGNRMKNSFAARIEASKQYGLEMEEKQLQVGRASYKVLSFWVRFSSGRGEPITHYRQMAFVVLPDREMVSDVEVVRRRHQMQDSLTDLAFAHCLDAQGHPRLRLLQSEEKGTLPLRGMVHPRIAAQHWPAQYGLGHQHSSYTGAHHHSRNEAQESSAMASRSEAREDGSARPAKLPRLQ